MVFLLNLGIGFMLVIFQTAIVPRLPIIENCFDLLLPFIIYQGIFKPFRESVFLVVGVGLLMDQLSGASLGLFVVIYLWVLVSVRWGLRFLHMGNYYLVPLIVAFAVILENAFFLVARIMGAGMQGYPVTAGATVLSQVGWAIISAPLFMILLNALHHGWAGWISSANEGKGDAVS